MTYSYPLRGFARIVRSEWRDRIAAGRCTIGLRNALTALCVALPALHAQAADSPPAMIVPGQFNVSSAGGFTYSIPIAVPPGIAAVAPALSLDYSSQRGDGLEGLGWNLSGLPAITRCPRTIAEDGVHGGVNYNADDRFCLNGQRLVAISGSYGASGALYRTEIDSFAKIESFGTKGTGPSYFRVWTKSGQVMEFGYTSDAKIFPAKADGSGPMTTVGMWALDKITDGVGNYLMVQYNDGTPDTTTGQVFPTEIDYTKNDAHMPSAFASVKFVYTPRASSDKYIYFYQAGAVQETKQLLSNIKTYSNGTLVTNYALTYTEATAGIRHYELNAVQQCNSDTVSSSHCLKTTSFGWQGGTSLSVRTQAISIAHNAPVLRPGSFTGTGLTDVLIDTSTAGQPCGIYANDGDGTFTASNMTANFNYWLLDHETHHWDNDSYSGIACFNQANTQFHFLPYRQQPVEFSGDGFTDFPIPMNYDTTDQEVHILLNSLGSPATNPRRLLDTSSYPADPAFAVTAKQYGDFNGDGMTDLLAAPTGGGVMSTYFSKGDGTFSAGWPYAITTFGGIGDFDGDGCEDVIDSTSSSIINYSCAPAAPTFTLPSALASASITTGDFNGDGKTDFLAVTSTGATLYLSTGVGVAAGIAISGSAGWSGYAIARGDFNGDGKDDIVLVGQSSGTSHKVYLSTGSGFVAGPTIANADTSPAPTVADWNNDGAADLWMQQASGDDEYWLYNDSATKTVLPELISSVSNGVGITTIVTYDRLNKNGSFYAKCSNGTYACGDAYPTQALDGALYAVSEIDVGNGIGGTYRTTYTYAGARTDLWGRGFLGFSSIVATDQQTGLVQTTRYDQAWPWIGLVASQTTVCPHPACTTTVTVNSTVNTYKNISLGTGTGSNGGPRAFVALAKSVVTPIDLTGTALPIITTTYTYDCDTGSTSICAGASPTGYGNATKIVAVTKYNGSTSSTKTVTNTFDNYTTNWHIGLLATTSVEVDIAGGSDDTRQASFDYNGTTGQRTDQIIEPEQTTSSPLRLETDYGYDALGNVSSSTNLGCYYLSGSCTTNAGTNPRSSRTTTITYDATTYHGQFPTTVANPLSQSGTWNYDQGFGMPLNYTDPNGVEVQWQYDGFGRRTLEKRPDTTQTATVYTYCTGLPSGESCPANAAYDVIATPQDHTNAQIGPITIAYYDGLSRVIATDVEGFDASGTGCTSSAPCWIRTDVLYDANARIHKKSRPYFLTGTGKYQTYTYDPLGRVTKVVFPDSSQTLYGFDGLTSTVTDDKGHVTTEVDNPQFQVGSVTDALSHATSYVYNGFADVLTVTDASSHTITNTYDLRGRKLTSSDPDMGAWSYKYDGFSELYTQTDAKSQVTTLTFDALSRPLKRVEPGLTSTWIYDTAAHGIGKLASATTGSAYTRTYTYDTKSRPATVTLAVDGTNYLYQTAYNATTGSVSTVAYPSGFTALYGYTDNGYLAQISDDGGATVFWKATGRDAELHLLTSVAGNGITTTNAFDADTGLPASIKAGTGNSIANQSFGFDTLGNLISRTWLNNAGSSVREIGCYDELNRLTGTRVVASGSTCTGSSSVAMTYSASGNISEKTDICSSSGCMHYGAGTAGPHALTSIDAPYDGISTPNFTYDLNGNLTCISSGTNCTGTVGRQVSVTSFNMAASITDAGNSAALTYDPEHNRIKQVTAGYENATTLYLNDPTTGSMEEKATVGTDATWRDYIIADGDIVALRSQGKGAPPAWGASTWGLFNWTAQSSSTVSVLYFTRDHLGSISVVTDSGGNVVERDSYDAWGKRRNADGSAAACNTVASATTRGFTSQEMMDPVCAINFNARVYDPGVGRFMSADTIVPDAFDGQSYNRYSYVNNGPLSETDPSGSGPEVDKYDNNPPPWGMSGPGIWSVNRYGVPISAAFTAYAFEHPDAFSGSAGMGRGGADEGAGEDGQRNAEGQTATSTQGQTSGSAISFGDEIIDVDTGQVLDSYWHSLPVVTPGLFDTNGAGCDGCIQVAANGIPQITLNRQQGLRAENQAESELVGQGYSVVRYVVFKDPATGRTAVIDMVAHQDFESPNSPTGKTSVYIFEEVKSGNGQLTINQAAVATALQNGTAIPIGPNARAVGLIPGQPTGPQVGPVFLVVQGYQGK